MSFHWPVSLYISNREHDAYSCNDLISGQHLDEAEPRSPTKSYRTTHLIPEVYWEEGCRGCLCALVEGEGGGKKRHLFFIRGDSICG